MSMISLSKLLVQNFIKDEEGASAVEYGLVLGLIAVLIIGFVIGIGDSTEGFFGDACTALVAGGGDGTCS